MASEVEPIPSARGLGWVFRGAGYPLRGFVYLARNTRAWPYALLPAALHLVVLLALGTAAYFLIDDVYSAVRPDSLAQPLVDAAWWQTILRGLLKALVAVAAFLLVAAGALLGTLLVAAVAAGPCNEQLSEVIELLATGSVPPDEPLRLGGLSRDTARAVVSALQRLTLFGVVYVPLLLLSVVPVLGVVGAVGTFLYSCFFLALNFLDPVLDRRKLGLREKLRWSRSVLGAHMGFGFMLFGLMLVPVVNLLIAPCFVVGGTLLWVDLLGLRGSGRQSRTSGRESASSAPAKM
jgi:CysZ protein